MHTVAIYGRDGIGIARALVKWGFDVYVEPTYVSPPLPQDVAMLLTKHLKAPFDLLIHHADPDNLGISKTARDCSDITVSWCADSDTEIFTRRGWITYPDLRAGEDQALGVNPDTGMAEWQVVEHLYVSEAAEHRMVRLEGVSHSSLTTEAHRWLVRDESGAWCWRTSGTLEPADRIPCSARSADVPVAAKYTDAFVELVAWTYTEGWLERGRSVRIGQNERVYPENADRIRSALRTALGLPRDWRDQACLCCQRPEPANWDKERHGGHGWIRARGLCHSCYMRERGHGSLSQWESYGSWTEGERKPDGMVIFNLSRPASQEILAACPGKVPSMEFLLSLTQSQLELFIEVSLAADGYEQTFSQTIGPRLDAFMTACALAGRRTSRLTRSKQHPHLGQMAVRRDSSVSVRGESSQYKGVVWCPTVRLGNWLARRDHCVFYTGNSMWEFGKARPLANRTSTFAKRMSLFDLSLMYDTVAVEAWRPHAAKRHVWGVLQGGYEAGEWKYFGDRDWFGDRFMFVMHGQLHNRKAPYVTIQAFNELKHEQPDAFAGARLGLHTTIGDPLVMFGNLIPGMKVWHEMWEKDVLEEFYRAAHVLVAPSRGEGKNLPALEMMTTGGAVAVTNWGGHTQWLRDDIAYPLDYELTPTYAELPDGAFDAKVSVQTMKDFMMHAITNRGEVKQKAELAAKVIPAQCDWPVVMERFFERARMLVPDKGEVLYGKAMSCRKE